MQKKHTRSKRRSTVNDVGGGITMNRRTQEMLFWGALVVLVQLYITFHGHRDTIVDGRVPSMKQRAEQLKNEFQSSSSSMSAQKTTETATSTTRRIPEQSILEKYTRRIPVGEFNGAPLYDLQFTESAQQQHGIQLERDQNQTSSATQQHQREESNQLYSQIHCIGDTYTREVSRHKMDTPWMSRSCKFHFMCFDTVEKDFVLFQDPREQLLERIVTEQPFMHMSQSVLVANHSHNPEHNDTANSLRYVVSLGGINQKWGNSYGAGIPNLQWFPKIIEGPAPISDIHMLPSNIVMMPFHSLAAFNPGHLVWDDLLPIFALLNIFQFDGTDDDDTDDDSVSPRTNAGVDADAPPFEPMLMRMVVEGLWASCDWKPHGRDIGREKQCNAMHKKFGTLISKFPVANNRNTNVTLARPSTASEPQPRHNRYVCAKQGAAGIGSLTDHGVTKGHGFHRNDYLSTHNVGRGAVLWKFRNYMMRQLNERTVAAGNAPLKVEPPIWGDSRHPYRILFSVASSGKVHRKLYFEEEKRLLTKEYVDNPQPKHNVSFGFYKMSDLSLTEQVEIVSQSAVYVTACGGGAVTASFLPRGATVILYCNEKGGIEHNKQTFLPCRLDWDLFNSMSYVRVYWMPALTRRSPTDQAVFMKLIHRTFEILDAEYAEE